jgi:hypothetical protein
MRGRLTLNGRSRPRFAIDFLALHAVVGKDLCRNLRMTLSGHFVPYSICNIGTHMSPEPMSAVRNCDETTGIQSFVEKLP